MDTGEGYRASLRAFLEREVYPYVEEWEKGGVFPRQVISSLGEQGLLAPCFPPKDGVRDHTFPLLMSAFRILIEEFAKTLCFGLTLTVSMHVGVFLPLLLDVASESLKDQLVEKALRGEILGTIAVTEYDVAGSDFMGMECTATVDQQKMVLNGQKHYITNAAVSDYVVVFARWRPGRHFTNFCALLVPTKTAGIHHSVVKMAVMKTAVISHLEFRNVELPSSHLLGRKELGMRYFFEHIATERLSGGIWAAVVAEHCLVETQRYVRGRHRGESTLWELGAVRQRLAQALVQVKLLQSLVERTLAKTDEMGYVDQFDSAIVKAVCAPMMEMVIGTCLQLHGARGLEAQSSLLRLLNEFRAFGVAGGPTETMLDVIAELWAKQTIKLP